MAFKVVFALCSSALLVQCIAGQCIGPYEGIARAGPLAYGAPMGPLNEWGCGGAWPAAPLPGIAASTGGGLVVSSASPMAPVGVSVVSDNAIEGALAVGGALPYLGAVALEAALPTVGAGAVAYGCGNGAVAITTEDVGAIGFAGVAGPTGFVPGITGPIPAGLAGPIAPGLAGPIGLPGYGCGAIL